MPAVRLILAVHNHQPVGNFEGVFESAYRDSYRPFLEVMEDYPQLPFVVHTSGPLLEWLVDKQPGYVARLRAMVEAGRVEILGGGFFEPILTMIPHRDRVGQIREYSAYLQDVFGAKVRGMWVAERVWEQHLVSAIAEAGIEYTILDDFHFRRAGLPEADLRGYYLTEDEGRLLKVFPGSERLRYAIPFREPHDTYESLRRLAHEHPGSTVVFADDGEKFGSWPETHEHVYTRGWLRRFCDMLVANSEWLQTTTFARAVDETLPLGKIYLPDNSYREMTEWALPPDRLAAYEEAVGRLGTDAQSERLRPFVACGAWRNFKARYPESDEMYARMLGLSRRLESAEADSNADPDYVDAARQELYRSQCNCPYWHGSFGGLYLPHLRGAIYRHLIAAHNALDEAEGRSGPRVEAAADDYDLDALKEVRLENDRLVALVRPARGGHVYELDVRHALTNVLATLDRRPEAYHAKIAAAVARGNGQQEDRERVRLKQEGLERLLVYDRHPRKALVDHFFDAGVTLDDLAACRDVERGDFATGTYLSRLHRGPDRVTLIMERAGRADGRVVHVRKSVELTAGEPALETLYVIEELPPDASLHFAVEFNIAALAGHADDRYFATPSGEKLGMLDARLDLPPAEGLTLTDEWLDLSVGLGWSRPAGVWCFPVETVSQSESGYEGVYQSSAVIPHWTVTADDSRRWEVRIRWTLDRSRPDQAVVGAGLAGSVSG
jgi:alpha-amylase